MKKITVEVTETRKVTEIKELELPCYLKWYGGALNRYAKIIDEKNVIEVIAGRISWSIEHSESFRMERYMDRDEWTPVPAKDFYIALEKALTNVFTALNNDTGGLAARPRKTIQGGDTFTYNGHIHTCVGTDGGMVWYCENGDEISEAVSVDPGDCILLANPESLGTL